MAPLQSHAQVMNVGIAGTCDAMEIGASDCQPAQCVYAQVVTESSFRLADSPN